jgi:hypothetical protein
MMVRVLTRKFMRVMHLRIWLKYGLTVKSGLAMVRSHKVTPCFAFQDEKSKEEASMCA